MAFNIMLDVNVMLDFTLKRAQYEKAKEIIALAVHNEVEAFITPAMIHIAGYWLTKAYGAGKAKKLLSTLLLDLSVIEMNHETAVQALHSKMDDIEDVLQYYTAFYHRLDFFISRDKELKKVTIPSLPVYTPEEFLNAFHSA